MASRTQVDDTYSYIFDRIDPVESLVTGLYKYDCSSERRDLLLALNKRMQGEFGEGTQFKAISSVLKYMWKIEDGETIVNSVNIQKDDLVCPQNRATRALSLYTESDGKPEKVSTSPSGGLCKVCQQKVAELLFRQCGHVLCKDCFSSIIEPTKKCPTCVISSA